MDQDATWSVAYLTGGHGSLSPLTIQKEIGPHPDLKYGNRNNVEATLYGCSNDIPFGSKTPVDSGRIGVGAELHASCYSGVDGPLAAAAPGSERLSRNQT